MAYIRIISIILLALFGLSYISKLIILKRKDKINANVLGKKNKDKKIHVVEISVKITSFVWLAVWLLEILFFDEISSGIGVFYRNILVMSIGVFINALGVVVFIIAAFSMRSSWRVGIDKDTKSTLITHGIYKYSRNPAFVGFDLMFIGLFIIYPNYITLLVMISNFISFHLLILQEEKHLAFMFGRSYTVYRNSTSRYLLF